MNKIEKMIKQFCPNGVEYKQIWELTAWDKLFNNLDRKMQSKVIKYPYLLANDMFALETETGNVKLLSTGNREGWTTEELAGDNLCEGEVVAIPWGGTPNIKYYKGKFVTADNRIATSLDINILNNKFLYYLMQNRIDEISSFYRGSGIKHPDMYKVLTMEIPVPPIEIQHEIVRILDNFSSLTAELTAELTARNKQYEYYRDKLLNVGGRYQQCIRPKNTSVSDEHLLTKIEKIGSVCDITAGGDVPKNSYSNVKNDKYSIPIISNGIDDNAIYGYTDTAIINKVAVTVAARGTIGWAAYRDYAYYPIVRLLSLIPKDDKVLNPKFLYYSLQGRKYNIPTTGIPQLTIPMLAKELITIPSLNIQNKIVHVLDHFEAICKDLNIGLPAEIELRKKQYEYYRDALLNFASTGEIDDISKQASKQASMTSIS